MTKIEAAIIALEALGTDEAAGAKSYMAHLTPEHLEAIDSNAVAHTAELHARKAEQYRSYKGASAARRAAAFQAIADALDNLPEADTAIKATYTVEQTETGVVLYVGPAASKIDALDRMARDAGYADFASIPRDIGGGHTLAVTEVGV